MLDEEIQIETHAKEFWFQLGQDQKDAVQRVGVLRLENVLGTNEDGVLKFLGSID